MDDIQIYLRVYGDDVDVSDLMTQLLSSDAMETLYAFCSGYRKACQKYRVNTREN